ncbi:uncharacterized protein LOC128920236 [Zeugodacus cucurbitae]|uniref:uncharacterized protein LOC128920236 n=1 Tax=Zeugodacus cucurbitae TaxID=28588 RepID=UPI0023D94864|nr:uncharacterized protein LOC128920236 [Zeugodacus cucurbitae]XP_054083101.1 uncharacterized protein LOC128920236 [Zeugodacus cucurbitae]
MKRIKQGKWALAEFYSEVSMSLNLALTKVDMDNHGSGNPSAMIEYANREAVRTFILGLNSKYTSGTLYSHNPKDLETAYAIVSPIYHDNEKLKFGVLQYNQQRQYNASQYQNSSRRHYEEPQWYRPNVQVQYNQTAPRQHHQPIHEIRKSQ